VYFIFKHIGMTTVTFKKLYVQPKIMFIAETYKWKLGLSYNRVRHY